MLQKINFYFLDKREKKILSAIQVVEGQTTYSILNEISLACLVAKEMQIIWIKPTPYFS
jgi:hypothetical protein